MANNVRHGLPLSTPGFHLGIKLITRIASPSNCGLTDRVTFASVILPSLFTIKETITLP